MSSNLFVRNNYFYPPVHHHCHGGNNFMNMMMGFSLIDMMWKNTFASIMPQRRQPAFVGVPAYQQPLTSFYPYAQFSSQQNMTQEDQDLAGLRQMYPDCVINKIDNKYWARSQTFVISADSILELSYRLQNKVDEAMAQLEAEAERARQQQEDLLNGNQPVDENDPAENPETSEQNTNLAKATDLKDSLGEVEYDTVRKGNPAVDEIVDQYATKLGDIDKAKLKKAIINANPDIFDTNGQLKDGAQDKWADLQLPTLEYVRSTMGPSGWFASGNANSDSYKFDIEKLKTDGVQAILNQYQADYGNEYQLDTEALKKDIIQNNQGIFNAEGKLISEDVNIAALRIPSSELIKSKYGKKYTEIRTKAADNKNLDLGNWENRTFKYSNTNNHIDCSGDKATIRFGNASYYIKVNGNYISGNTMMEFIDSNGHFKPERFGNKIKTLQLEGIANGAAHSSSTIQVRNERVVLQVGKQAFSLDDIMCGNIPFEKVKADRNGNEYACISSY